MLLDVIAFHLCNTVLRVRGKHVPVPSGLISSPSIPSQVKESMHGMVQQHNTRLPRSHDVPPDMDDLSTSLKHY